MKEKLFSLRTAAKEAGIPYATLHFWIFNGVVKMPALKVGCRYFYTAEEVAALKKEKANHYKRKRISDA